VYLFTNFIFIIQTIRFTYFCEQKSILYNDNIYMIEDD